MKCLGVDTETLGLDAYHGCSVFLITTCNEEGEQTWWETHVNPLTRKAKFSEKDLLQVKQHLLSYDVWYFQNPVFDVTFLYEAGCKWILKCWDRIRDTGIAAHLVDSSHKKKNLDSLVLNYLGMDISRYENILKKGVMKAQGKARKMFPEWRVCPVASSGVVDPTMPSGSGWKADMWLLKLMARKLKLPKDHFWWNSCLEYANVDSSVVLPLGKHLETIIKQKGLWKIYKKRLELLELTYAMQSKGISLEGSRTIGLKKKYDAEATKFGKKCIALAKRVGGELELPKAGNNNSLAKVVFENFKLEPIKVSKKTGAPSLDGDFIDHHLKTLPKSSKARHFLKNLSEKRRRDTASGTYLTGYMRAWIPAWVGAVDPITGAGWYILHPSLNPVGTSTLRWSSKSPNEQNISKKKGFNLRHCFGPAKGREWWSADAKNIELRIPAYESGEQELINLFEKSEEPPYYGSEHILNFSTVYPDIWEKEIKAVGFDKVGPHCKKKYEDSWYKYCKNGDFAVQYGAIERDDIMGTADKAFRRKGSHSRLKQRFSAKEKLNKYWIDFANKHGYVETMPDKSVDPKRGYPLVCLKDEWGKIKPTIPLSYHVQGSACWWMGMAMIRCYNFFEQLNKERYGLNTAEILLQHAKGKMLNRGYFLIAQIHDELVFDFPKNKKKNLGVMLEVKRLMEIGGEGIGVPTPVGVEYHETSYDIGETIAL